MGTGSERGETDTRTTCNREGLSPFRDRHFGHGRNQAVHEVAIMNRLSRLWHSAKYLGSTVGVWLAVAGMAVAQEKPAESGGGGPPYVGPYFIVVLCLALGLMVVCNPARRKDKAKIQYEVPPEEAGKH
jgi:hypothetical protein